jgi:hypothetical protein
MKIEDLKKLMRKGRKCQTMYLISSYVSIRNKLRDAQTSSILFIPRHVRNTWVDVEVLASEDLMWSSASSLGTKLYGRIGYEHFTIFREWDIEDAPLIINFKVISKSFKKIAFGI